MYNYYPKRPIKSFQDLEVYQKLLAICVAVVKRIPVPKLAEVANEPLPMIETINKLHRNALDLPIKIATAHSLRFSDCQKAIDILEEAMLNCNLAVVYLEQYRDIYNVPLPKLPGIESKASADCCPEVKSAEVEIEFFEEQIKSLLSVRMKILHLQMSWKKFSKERNEEHV